MVHPAIIVSAVIAGVGGAIAFETAVFKPWRQEHGSFAEGIKNEWNGLVADVRHAHGEFRRAGRRRRRARRLAEGGRLGEDSGSDSESGSEDSRDTNGPPPRHPNGGGPIGGPRDPRAYDAMDTEFEMHEREVLQQRDRLRALFTEDRSLGEGGGLRQRRKVSGPLIDLGGSDMIAPQIRAQQFDAESPHHAIGSYSPTLSASPTVDDSVVSEPAESPVDGAHETNQADTHTLRHKTSNLSDNHHSVSGSASPHRASATTDSAYASTYVDVHSSWDAVPTASDRAAHPSDSQHELRHLDLDQTVWASATMGGSGGMGEPAFQEPMSARSDAYSATTSTRTSDLELVSPPASLSHGWELESASSELGLSSAHSVDGRSSRGDAGTSDAAWNSPRLTASTRWQKDVRSPNPFDEAVLIDEETDDSDSDHGAAEAQSHFQRRSKGSDDTFGRSTLRARDAAAPLSTPSPPPKPEGEGLSTSASSWADLRGEHAGPF